jgi:hypothetical protein
MSPTYLRTKLSRPLPTKDWLLTTARYRVGAT